MLIGRKSIGTVAYMGGIPCVLEEFAWCWGQFVQFNNEYMSEKEYIHYDRAKISDHGPARNSLVDRFLGNWLLMLDTDHAFEPDLLQRILDRVASCKADVFVGIYQYKGPPYLPVLYADQSDPNDKDSFFPQIIAKWTRPIIQVGSAGGGCLFVKRSVYDCIENELHQNPFDKIINKNGTMFSEDHSFFFRLKKLGIKAYCDTRIEYRHLKIDAVKLSQIEYDGLELNEAIKTDGFV